LQELARLPVAVVSSGVKSILDIGKTLEYLETIGVCVATFDPTGSRDFPAFFTSKSGFQAPFNVQSELEAAKLIHTNLRLGFNSGLLIAVPIPEEYSADNEQIDRAINEAIADLKKLKITGKKVTPFLLDRINKLTGGNSLKSNIALIRNNAKLSAQIAVELFKLQEASKISSKNTNQFKESENLITVIGATNLDNIYELTDEKTLHIKGVTQPSKFTQVLGGVGRNMTEALIGMGVNPILISAIGNDLAGILVHQESQKRGFNMNHLEILSDTNISTGSYCAIFEPNGQINMAAGSMRVHDHISVDMVKKRESLLINSEICVLDANIPSETIDYVCELCEKNRIPVWFNPTDIRKCHKMSKSISKLTYISPNLKELIQIFKETLDNDRSLEIGERKALEIIKSNTDSSINDENLNEILKYLLNFTSFIILTRGEKDLILASRYDLNLNQKNQLPTKKFNLNRAIRPCVYYFPIIKLEPDQRFVNESGAGDCSSAGIIAGILKGFSLSETIYNGLLAGRLALTSSNNVPNDFNSLTSELLSAVLNQNKLKIKKVCLN
jgi:pseudouridine-5'-phosphate glycosidase/pseudouridine kinase